MSVVDLPAGDSTSQATTAYLPWTPALRFILQNYLFLINLKGIRFPGVFINRFQEIMLCHHMSQVASEWCHFRMGNSKQANKFMIPHSLTSSNRTNKHAYSETDLVNFEKCGESSEPLFYLKLLKDQDKSFIPKYRTIYPGIN